MCGCVCFGVVGLLFTIGTNIAEYYVRPDYEVSNHSETNIHLIRTSMYGIFDCVLIGVVTLVKVKFNRNRKKYFDGTIENVVNFRIITIEKYLPKFACLVLIHAMITTISTRLTALYLIGQLTYYITIVGYSVNRLMYP